MPNPTLASAHRPSPSSHQPLVSKRKGYVIQNGVVLLEGKKVGSIDAKGRFEVVDRLGTKRTGTVASLITGHIRNRLLNVRGGKGPSGRLRIGPQLYQVVGGTVMANAQPVGTITREGDFKVTRAGRTTTGNVLSAPGVIWFGPKNAQGRSGMIKVHGQSYQALEGIIFELGEEIGTLDTKGHFRAVTSEGLCISGQVDQPSSHVVMQLVIDDAGVAHV